MDLHLKLPDDLRRHFERNVGDKPGQHPTANAYTQALIRGHERWLNLEEDSVPYNVARENWKRHLSDAAASRRTGTGG